MKIYKRPVLSPQSSGRVTYLYIYFRDNNVRLRYNTLIEYDKGNHLKNHFFSQKHPDANELNNLLTERLRKMGEYIHIKISAKQPLNQKECTDFINERLKGSNINPILREEYFKLNTSQMVFTNFKSFYAMKKNRVTSPTSLKDYKSLENALVDYHEYLQKNKRKALTIMTMDTEEFLPEFNQFLVTERNMKDNTIHKRIQTLRSFMMYLEKSDFHTFKKSSLSYLPKKYQSNQIALSLAELGIVEKLTKLTKSQNEIRDMFLLMSYTGMPYQDLRSFNKNRIDYSASPAIYTYIRIKTNERCHVPLFGYTLNLLNKYDTLPVFTSQHFNREIQNILKDSKKFNTEIECLHFQNGRQVIEYKPKYKMIGTHTPRRTFITNSLIKGIGVNVIASVTGHKSIATINKYAKKVKELSAFGKLFE